MSGSGEQKQREWTSRRVALVCLAPAAFSLAWLLVAELVPADTTWGHVLHSIGLMAPRWLMALTPLVCIRVAIAARRWRIASVIGVLACPLAGVPDWTSAGRGTRVLVGNVNAYTLGEKELASALANSGADVVVQVEARAKEIPGFVRVADNFTDVLPRPSYASAVFCRQGVRCEGHVTEQFGSATMKMPVALVRLSTGICVMGMHGPPPVPLDASGLLPHMQRVADMIRKGRMVKPWGPCRVGDPVVMAGDMNAVPGSWATRLFEPTGLTDQLWHWGMFALSWPVGGDVANLPTLQLDHLWSGPVEVTGIDLVRLPGADHRAVVATLAIPEE